VVPGIPHDFSPQATAALKAAAVLAKQHGGKLTVLRVPVPFYLPAEVRSAWRRRAALRDTRNRDGADLGSRRIGRATSLAVLRVRDGGGRARCSA
jgi:hypothetical protein